jgi:predicted nucleic-acid-binding protein
MPALDTNVLVRLLVQDDAVQTAAVVKLLQTTSLPLYVPVTVMQELEWVLRSRYRFAKAQVVDALTKLLSTQELQFDQESELEIALHDYQNSTADFSDCMHSALAYAAGYAPLLSFDKNASKLSGVALIPASV